jgi:hypothetical protein
MLHEHLAGGGQYRSVSFTVEEHDTLRFFQPCDRLTYRRLSSSKLAAGRGKASFVNNRHQNPQMV